MAIKLTRTIREGPISVSGRGDRYPKPTRRSGRLRNGGIREAESRQDRSARGLCTQLRSGDHIPSHGGGTRPEASPHLLCRPADRRLAIPANWRRAFTRMREAYRRMCGKPKWLSCAGSVGRRVSPFWASVFLRCPGPGTFFFSAFGSSVRRSLAADRAAGSELNVRPNHAMEPTVPH